MADALAAHLWFPGDGPHQYDFVAEANARGVRRGKFVPREKRLAPNQEPKANQVRYYRNPLERLVSDATAPSRR